MTARRKANRNKQRYQADGQELQDVTRQISDRNYGSRHSRQLHKDRTNRVGRQELWAGVVRSGLGRAAGGSIRGAGQVN